MFGNYNSSMKDVIIIMVVMIGFVLVAKELRQPEITEVIFTDEEIEAWEPFD